ncbi:hypothetical protein NUACC21_27970 [Scytonema sp. NUACC21]
MRINKITYHDRELEWEFEPIEFSNLTLLVGASGVGKTQILESIMNLRKIAMGKSLNGIEWDINFTVQNYNYQWKGEFENKKVTSLIIEDDRSEKENFKIIREELYQNNEKIVERSSNEIIFRGNKLPKLSSFKSIVEILSEEEDIAPIKKGFNKVIYSEQSIVIAKSINAASISIYASLAKNASYSLEEIQEMNLQPQTKLAIAYKYLPEVFTKIKETFIDIFVQVEDIKIEPDDNEDDFSRFLAEYPFIHIKEKGVNHWINQNQISSGMFRTLLHISELYLSAEGTVILIDEFENSSGVNCIDVVTDILLRNRNIQFILTSHHPYVINNIEMAHWKIVTRRKGVVTARNAKDFNLGKSKHQAFVQLINLDAYKEGIAVG